MVDRTKALLKRFDGLLANNALRTGAEQFEGRWVFGTAKPTALDAHLIPFVERLSDIGRESLIPKNLLNWAANATKEREWTELMEGRSTMFRG